ncbi:MAG: SAM-dependent methyltransferase [Oscillospiraceae bacterium]|mgnify:CR=1 FL=1|jgi:tRNA (adenine22-N1)-methyltransferase|nr:SAM-dependent methyltransferase [Oscillospiraceae bacterium]
MPEKLELGPRLRAIADLVPPDCRCLADIGTDHGYVPAALLLAGRVGRAVAADVGALPLDHARRTAARCGVEDRMDLRLGDGLSVLSPGEADVIVIAGMGGDTIAGILAAAPWSRDGPLLLLQPMSRACELRRWLPEQGYAVRAETLVQDKGVLYPILSAAGGTMAPASEAQAWGGFLLEGDPLWGRYLSDRILRLRRAAAGLERARDPALAVKRTALLSAAAALEQKREEWSRGERT